MQDAIIREITLKASQERVYTAMTDLSEITKWFPEAVEDGTLAVGQEPTFVFMEGQRKRRVIIQANDPYSYFAFRWAPGPEGLSGEHVLDLPNTLIEFLVEAVGNETKVTVKESGFAALPVGYADSTHQQNSGGWDYMVDRLSALLN